MLSPQVNQMILRIPYSMEYSSADGIQGHVMGGGQIIVEIPPPKVDTIIRKSINR
jgi:hypothetical protein